MSLASCNVGVDRDAPALNVLHCHIALRSLQTLSGHVTEICFDSYNICMH